MAANWNDRAHAVGRLVRYKRRGPVWNRLTKVASPPGPRMSEGNIADVPENFIRIGNKLYDAKKIEAWHPGGKIYIQGSLAFNLHWHASTGPVDRMSLRKWR